jgi:WD40 repeat protein
MAWSPDGKHIASSSGLDTVQVWDAHNGSHLYTYKGHPDSVQTIAWSPDGKRIASGGLNGTVQVWQPPS